MVAWNTYYVILLFKRTLMSLKFVFRVKYQYSRCLPSFVISRLLQHKIQVKQQLAPRRDARYQQVGRICAVDGRACSQAAQRHILLKSTVGVWEKYRVIFRHVFRKTCWVNCIHYLDICRPIFVLLVVLFLGELEHRKLGKWWVS